MKIKNKITGKFEASNLYKKCIICNKEFRVKPCNFKKSKYCSRKCFSIGKKGKKLLPETIAKIVKANTGKKRDEKFRLNQSIKQMGSNNSNYNGGWTKDKIAKRNYGEKQRFGKTKDEWIEYFGGKCVICGITNYQHIQKFGLRLSLHHKDHNGRNSKHPNNNEDNLMLLCSDCHGKIHLDKERAKQMQKLSVKRGTNETL